MDTKGDTVTRRLPRFVSSHIAELCGNKESILEACGAAPAVRETLCRRCPRFRCLVEYNSVSGPPGWVKNCFHKLLGNWRGVEWTMHPQNGILLSEDETPKHVLLL